MLQSTTVTATNVSIAEAAEVLDPASTPDSFGEVVDFVELNPSGSQSGSVLRRGLCCYLGATSDCNFEHYPAWLRCQRYPC